MRARGSQNTNSFTLEVQDETDNFNTYAITSEPTVRMVLSLQIIVYIIYDIANCVLAYPYGCTHFYWITATFFIVSIASSNHTICMKIYQIKLRQFTT